VPAEIAARALDEEVLRDDSRAAPAPCIEGSRGRHSTDGRLNRAGARDVLPKTRFSNGADQDKPAAAGRWRVQVQPHPLFEWQDVLFQYVGFLASFWMLGAIGFRFGILRRGVGAANGESDSPRAAASARAAAAAAGIGVLGVGLGVVSFVEGLLKRAAAKHQTFGDAFSAGGATSLAQGVLLVVLLVAFVLAWRRVALGWPIAGVAAMAFALRNVLAGKLAGMVNPLHILGGSLWLGTLFVLVVCGVGQMLRPAVPAARREEAVAEMVHRFSVLGLGGSALLAATGLVTGWTHLNPLSALWTTPYGYALLAKLGIVAVVAGLGAWNWRRIGPSLGTEGGAAKIRRSASTELAFAAVVLLLTAILVSLPSPKLPLQAIHVVT
jgi:putative copper export protein